MMLYHWAQFLSSVGIQQLNTKQLKKIREKDKENQNLELCNTNKRG